MVHYEGGVEVELRSSFDGVGDKNKSHRKFLKNFLWHNNIYNLILNSKNFLY